MDHDEYKKVQSMNMYKVISRGLKDLNSAIARHDRHLKGKEATSKSSQKKLMHELEEAKASFSMIEKMHKKMGRR